ncbi:hypothetical protein [uncultured Campylobacter sp.]|uniref:hypothetical protein n=1 Tax=uncultured Campylobacter sp. TaxID=218934 RepID=UPI002610004B|nr:hypothetical protein [uncultured Campylobacter sp.]
MNKIAQDLRAIIAELMVLEKRLDALKLKIDLAHGANREPYKSWIEDVKEIKETIERIRR